MERYMTAALNLIILIIYCSGVASIRLQQILVAHQVGRGEDVQLRCHFLLEGHTLYSVKWFKGSHEFFRYAPKETPAKKVFLLNELTVDIAQSNETQVTLRNVQHSNAGTYRCEVSAEAPHFETDYREANMTVIDLPLHGPIIVNVQSSYRPAELVLLNCSSAPSRPMAILKWNIDGHHADDAYVRPYVDGSNWASQAKIRKRQRFSGAEGWKSSDEEADVAYVGLEFIIDDSVSKSRLRRVNVTCTAYVGDIYVSSTHASLLVIDERYAASVERTTPLRQPSHLHASSGAVSHVPNWLLAATTTFFTFEMARQKHLHSL